MIKEKSFLWLRFSKQLGTWFAVFPLAPNHYTWLTVPAALLGWFAFVRHDVWLGVLLFILAGIFDVIDGALARHRNITSGSGAFLDGSLDRFIDFILLFSYFWLPLTLPWLPLSHWLCLAIFFAIMPSFEVAYANHRKAVIDPDEKLIWRILNRGEMYVLMLLIPVVAVYSSRYAGYLLVLLVALSAITTFQTLFQTLRLSNRISKL